MTGLIKHQMNSAKIKGRTSGLIANHWPLGLFSFYSKGCFPKEKFLKIMQIIPKN
jgi:hypothetical protein